MCVSSWKRWIWYTVISCSALLPLCSLMGPTLWNNWCSVLSTFLDKWWKPVLMQMDGNTAHYDRKPSPRAWGLGMCSSPSEGAGEVCSFFFKSLGKVHTAVQEKRCHDSDKLIKLSLLSIICIAKKKNLNFLCTVWHTHNNTHKINAGGFFQSCPYYWFLVCRTEVLEALFRTNKKSQHLSSFCNLHMYVYMAIDIRMLFTKMWELRNTLLGSSLCVLPPLLFDVTSVGSEASRVGGGILVSLFFTPKVLCL